jgi:transposase
VLVPTVARRDVVVMENLPAHKLASILRPSRLGAPVCCTCSFTLEFNPIENAFAKLKALLRKPQPAPSVTSGVPSVAPYRCLRRLI